jgi:hypothetical protein
MRERERDVRDLFLCSLYEVCCFPNVQFTAKTSLIYIYKKQNGKKKKSVVFFYTKRVKQRRRNINSNDDGF